MPPGAWPRWAGSAASAAVEQAVPAMPVFQRLLGEPVDVHVSWLRTKLRQRDGHDYFRTVRGVGYAFAPRPEPA